MIDFLLVEDENDATEMATALRPLRNLAHETGCTVILLHHDRKAEGKGLQMLRGSTAIAATFDFLLRIDYLYGEYEPERKVEVTGRYNRDRFHCRLGPDGYELVDAEEVATERKESRRQAGALRRDESDERDAARLLAWLRGREAPATLEEMRIEGSGFGRKRLGTLLMRLVRDGKLRHHTHKGSSPATWEPAEAGEEAPENEGGEVPGLAGPLLPGTGSEHPIEAILGDLERVGVRLAVCEGEFYILSTKGPPRTTLTETLRNSLEDRREELIAYAERKGWRCSTSDLGGAPEASAGAAADGSATQHDDIIEEEL